MWGVIKRRGIKKNWKLARRFSGICFLLAAGCLLMLCAAPMWAQCNGCTGNCADKGTVSESATTTAWKPAVKTGCGGTNLLLLETSLHQFKRAVSNLVAVSAVGLGEDQIMAGMSSVRSVLQELVPALRKYYISFGYTEFPEHLMTLSTILKLVDDVEEASVHINHMTGSLPGRDQHRKGDLLLIEFLRQVRVRALGNVLDRLDMLRADNSLAGLYTSLYPDMVASLSGFKLVDAILFHEGCLYIVDSEDRTIHMFNVKPATTGAPFSVMPYSAGVIDIFKEGEGELQGICFDKKGNLLVGDEGLQTVHILTPKDGQYVLSGTLDHPAGLFDRPRGLIIGVDDEILVSDGKARKIHVFDHDYRYLRTLAVFQDEFTQIEAMLPLGDNMFLVTNEYNHKIGRFTTDGDPLGQFGRVHFMGQPEGMVSLPEPVDGHRAFMVVDELFGELEIFSLENFGHLRTIRLGTGEGRFNLKSPDGITLGRIDGKDYLFISDQKNKRAVIFDLKHLLRYGEFCFFPDPELLEIMNATFDFIVERKFRPQNVMAAARLRARLIHDMDLYLANHPFSGNLFAWAFADMELCAGIDIEDQEFSTQIMTELVQDFQGYRGKR